MRLLPALPLALLLVACASVSPGQPWQSPRGHDHPLAGRIWDVRAAGFVSPGTLIDRLAHDEFVLLGETHDNPDHHRLQAWIVEQLYARGRRPTLAMEMVSPEAAGTLARYLARAPRDAAGLGPALDWKHSGWPDWSFYQPIVQAALDAGAPVVSANLSRETTLALRRGGFAALPAGVPERLALDRPEPPGAHEAAVQEIRESHCGRLPEAMVGGMAAVQRARDAQMADAMLAAATDGTVLIAGRGHVRSDRAVPFFLRARRPEARVASVALLEVQDAETTPAAYAEDFAAGALPFDWAWFTPRGEDGDPCANMPAVR